MKYLIAAALLVLAPMSVFAQGPAQQAPPIQYQPDPDSPIGERNPNGPPQLAEFDFVIGDWDVVIDYIAPNGQTVTYEARWHNHWILNGMAVMQEWRGPYATGAEFRAWNVQAQEWQGQNIYPTLPNGWRTTTARRFDDRMEIYIDAVDADGPMINREVYSEITEDRMRMHSEISRDGGETWETGRYSMVMTRR